MTPAKPQWTWERVADAGSVVEFTLNGPDVLCRYWYDRPPSKDARLIAAAPDMYEALKAVVSVADRKTVEFDLARAALARAEART